MRTRIFHLATQAPQTTEGIPAPFYHEVVATAYLDIDLSQRQVQLSGTHRGTKPEATIVAEFFRGLPETDKAHLPTLISWYGKNFSVPVMLSRAVFHQLDASYYLQNGYHHRFSVHHFDAADWIKWNLAGGKRTPSLDDAAQLLCIPPRIKLDIPAAIQGKEYQHILNRVALDVLITALFWLRAECVSCNITGTDHDAMKQIVLAAYRGKCEMFDAYLEGIA